MLRRSARGRTIHVYLDGEVPAAEVIAACERGECLIVQGKRPDAVKLANVLVRVIDAQIAREDEEHAVRESKEKAANATANHVSG